MNWNRNTALDRSTINGDNEFRFNDASNHEGHLSKNGILIWFGIETAIIIITSRLCMKVKHWTNGQQ